jgi:glucose-6-phosphate isomerase
VNATPPTDCHAWKALAARAAATPSLAELFARDPARTERMAAQAPGVRFDYSRQRLDRETIGLLLALASERGLAGADPGYHVGLRAGNDAPADIKATLARMHKLAAKLRGRGRIRRIVHLGTGGSALGPQLVADALGAHGDPVQLAFAANLDPHDLGRALEGAEPGATLFLVVSKSFDTAETLANAHAARRWLGGSPAEAAQHFIAVTANDAAARAFGVSKVLPMPRDVTGRFSLWSAASFGALCAIGAEKFDALLAGAREMDRHAARAPIERNVPALMALVGIWNVNFLGAATQAVLPYAHALRLLPSHLQQLEMESNGKGVDRQGRALAYATAPVVWGAEGTPGQHSFMQLLHQGTQVVPADFITCGVSAELDAQAEAQARALAFGTTDPGLAPERRHPGNRPSSTLRLERLDAAALGQLLALYEHKVVAQGVLWNVNSFDQWGVELGKQLARDILSRRP